MYGVYTAKYIVKKSNMVERRPAGLHEKTSDNISLAHHLDKTCLDRIDESLATWYKEYGDVKLEPFQCNVPGYNHTERAIVQMWGQIEAVTGRLGNPLLSDDI